MGNDTSILRERLDERRRVKGISPRALSLQIGANHSYVSQLLSGKGGAPSSVHLARLAEALETSVDYLTGVNDSPAVVQSEVGLADKAISWRGFPREEPGIPLVGTGDCAALEVRAETGQMVAIERSSFDPEYHVRYLTRPPALRGQTGLYAIYFHGDSMLPRFEPGEVGIVDPHRPAQLGDYVLVQLRGEDSDDVESVLVKRLAGRNAREVQLEQFNPAITFTLPARLVKRMHRIMPQTDLLF